MTKATVNEVIKRAVSDAAFRRQLQRDPSGTLAGFELTADERAAITGGDPGKLMSLGIDQRMSKAFVIGGLAGTANASVVSEGGASFNAALVDENVAAGNKSVIELDPGHASGTGVIAGDPGSASVTAFDTTTASTDLNTVDAGTLGASRAAIDPGAASGDLNAIDAGYTGGGSAALTDPSRSEAMDLNTLDAGIASRTAARESLDATEVRDVNQDANWDSSNVTAFEPAPSSAGDLNVIDAGSTEVDSSFDVEVSTDKSAHDAGSGLDTGGDVRPTEY